MRTMETVECKACQVKFSAIKSASRKYCSRICYLKFPHSVEQNTRVSRFWKGKKLGKDNPIWKGNKVGYTALHSWIKRRFHKPLFCQNCKLTPPYDLANISQEYKRDLSDWEWLCRRCHMKKDGRMDQFIINARKQAIEMRGKNYVSLR